jgi:hypothetical protein
MAIKIAAASTNVRTSRKGPISISTSNNHGPRTKITGGPATGTTSISGSIS